MGEGSNVDGPHATAVRKTDRDERYRAIMQSTLQDFARKENSLRQSESTITFNRAIVTTSHLNDLVRVANRPSYDEFDERQDARIAAEKLVESLVKGEADALTLYNLAIKHSVWSVRKAALEKIASGLSRFPVWVVRKVAETSLVLYVAKNADEKDIGFLAVERLTSENELVTVAVLGRNQHVAESAAWKVRKPERLVEIAMAARHTNVRRDVIGRLDDPDLVAWIAETDVEADVRTTAVARLRALAATG